MDLIQFIGLVPKLESAEFIGMKIESANVDLPDVCVEPLHGEGTNRVFRVYQDGSNLSKVFDAPGVVTELGAYFDGEYHRAICQKADEFTVYSRTNRGVHIHSEPTHEFKGKHQISKFDVDYLIETPRIRVMLAELGILSERGVIRKEQHNKLIQIKNFIRAIYDILPQFQDQRHLNVVDAACGKSYLSFVLSYFFREEWGVDARFQGIDTNEQLITRCKDIQQTLSYPHMEFIASTVNDFASDRKIDVLYSLHGCDTATDEAIAAGVRLNSQVIIVVPCCHFELKNQLRDHPLKGITKYGLFKDRFATLLTDALRSLALEAAGYDVSNFRFVTDDISPKNTLLRAIRRRSFDSHALNAYYELRNMFNVHPTIEKLLPSVFQRLTY